MNTMIITGLAIGTITMLVDRFIVRIPSKLAVVIYLVAVVLMFAGMIASKNNG